MAPKSKKPGKLLINNETGLAHGWPPKRGKRSIPEFLDFLNEFVDKIDGVYQVPSLAEAEWESGKIRNAGRKL